MIRITQAQAAHFLLQKNYLAAARPVPISQLVQNLVGLPAVSPLTLFLTAFSRLPGFEPTHLLAELQQERRLIHTILMRSADTLVATADYPAWYAATTRQHNQAFNGEFRLWGLDNDEVESLSRAVLAEIDDQPGTAPAITGRLPSNLVRTLSQTSRGGRVTTTSNVALVLRWLVARGKLAIRMDFSPGLENWQSARLIYAPLRYWYPQLDLQAAPPEPEAQASLVRAYLAAFGPASEADISAWTGFGKSETARAINTLASETTLVLLEGIPGMMLLLKDQAEALAATPPLPGPVVNILPEHDPYVSTHRASRTWLLADPRLQRHVFTSSGAARPTLVLNGQVMGVWQWEPAGDSARLAWRPLVADVEPELRSQVEAELSRVAAFLGPEARVEEVTEE